MQKIRRKGGERTNEDQYFPLTPVIAGSDLLNEMVVGYNETVLV